MCSTAWRRFPTLSPNRCSRGGFTLVVVPELPEVEALAIFLRERASGHVIARADAASFAVLKTFAPPLSALTGRALTGAGRHGKFLDLTCTGQDGDLHLIFHLARAGWLRWREDMPDKPVRPGKGPLAFRLVFDDGAGFDLTEAGTQKRLAVYVVADPGDVPGVATLGPEPLAADFTAEALAAILKERRTQIKGVLRDQHIIAGIGNAYSDEVLHAAKMSPFKLASSFTADDIATLHTAIVTTLREAVERSAGLAAAELKGEKKTGLRVHGKTGQPCPVCGDTIREVSFADSSLQYCPTCQTGGKPLADRRLSRLLKLNLTAVHEESPPRRADKVLDPVQDVRAGGPAALVLRAVALAPDNAHQTPPLCFGGLRRQWPAPGRGRPPRGRPPGVPGNPPEPGTRGATVQGRPRGNNRATMRSAVLTVALLPISCLHEPTTLQVNEESLVMSGFGHPRPTGDAPVALQRRHRRPPRPRATAGTLNGAALGALAQLEEHLLCKQGVRGSSPLSSTQRSSRFGWSLFTFGPALPLRVPGPRCRLA
jgi:DNA-formamidopyrimidine glycosylase